MWLFGCLNAGFAALRKSVKPKSLASPMLCDVRYAINLTSRTLGACPEVQSVRLLPGANAGFGGL